MTKRFIIGEKVKTRNGLNARIIGVNRKHQYYPIVALVTNAHGEEDIQCYDEEGRFWAPTPMRKAHHELDLVREPVITRCWHGVSQHGVIMPYRDSKEDVIRYNFSNYREKPKGFIEKVFIDNTFSHANYIPYAVENEDGK